MGARDSSGARAWRWIAGSTFALCAACGFAASAGAATAGASPAGASGLSVNATGEVLYDSNLLRGGVATALNPNPHSDDFRYSPALTATYGRSAGRIALTVDGVIGRDFFQYNKYLDSNRYTGGGTVTYSSGASCQLVVNGNVAVRQNGIRGANTPLIDPLGLPADDVGTLTSNTQTSSRYGANAGCGSPTGRLSFNGGYAHSSLSNAAARSKFADSDSDVFNGSVGIGILRPGQLSLTGSYSTIVYPNRSGAGLAVPLPPQLLNAGVRTYRVGLAFSRPIGTRLSGTIGASLLHSNPSGGQAPYTSPAYNVGLTYAPSERLNFSLTGNRDIVPSTTAGALFRVVDQVSVISSYSLGEAITINANAGLIRNNYKQPFALNGLLARSLDTTKTFGIGLLYAPRSLYDIGLNVSQTLRSSNPSILNYNSTKASVTLAVHI